ncbi:hypothetical protein KI387_039478, partial [Taxus chinensis]
LLAEFYDGSIMFHFGVLPETDEASDIPQQTQICETDGNFVKNSEAGVSAVDVCKLKGDNKIQCKDFVEENNMSVDREELDGFSAKRMKMCEDNGGRVVDVRLENSVFDLKENSRIEAGKCQVMSGFSAKLKEDSVGDFDTEGACEEKKWLAGDGIGSGAVRNVTAHLLGKVCESSLNDEMKLKDGDRFHSHVELTVLAHTVPEPVGKHGENLAGSGADATRKVDDITVEPIDKLGQQVNCNGRSNEGASEQ